MANPQKENGFTTIANEILDNIIKFKFNATQLNIIMTIWRYTYGFNRKEANISLGFISKATGTHKDQIKRELNKLIKKKVILIVKEASFNNARILTFNKNYEDWKICKILILEEEQECIQVTNLLTGDELAHSTGDELAHSTGDELAHSTGDELAPQERNNKKNNKYIVHDVQMHFEKIWTLYPNKKGKGQISQTKKNELYKLGDQIVRCIERYIQDVERRRSKFPGLNYQNGSTFFNSGYLDYLDKEYKELCEEKQAIVLDRYRED